MSPLENPAPLAMATHSQKKSGSKPQVFKLLMDITGNVNSRRCHLEEHHKRLQKIYPNNTLLETNISDSKLKISFLFPLVRYVMLGFFLRESKSGYPNSTQPLRFQTLVYWVLSPGGFLLQILVWSSWNQNKKPSWNTCCFLLLQEGFSNFECYTIYTTWKGSMAQLPMYWFIMAQLTKPPFGRCAIYFHNSVVFFWGGNPGTFFVISKLKLRIARVRLLPPQRAKLKLKKHYWRKLLFPITLNFQ